MLILVWEGSLKSWLPGREGVPVLSRRLDLAQHWWKMISHSSPHTPSSTTFFPFLFLLFFLHYYFHSSLCSSMSQRLKFENDIGCIPVCIRFFPINPHCAHRAPELSDNFWYFGGYCSANESPVDFCVRKGSPPLSFSSGSNVSWAAAIGMKRQLD